MAPGTSEEARDIQRRKTADLVAEVTAVAATAAAKVVEDAAKARETVLGKENSVLSVQVAVLTTKMASLEKQVQDLDTKFDKVLCELKDLVAGRPTWAVTIMMSVLSSATVGMAIYIITKL